MTQLITVIGAGLSGTSIAYKLLRLKQKVRIIDAGSKLIRPDLQAPWGWRRRISLQSEVKTKYLQFDGYLDNFISSKKGPMLITTLHDNTTSAWKEWINQHDTDAHILTPKETEEIYNIPQSYFKNKGGTFVCDTRDSLMDFTQLNHHLWNYLESDPNCEFIQIHPLQK